MILLNLYEPWRAKHPKRIEKEEGRHDNVLRKIAGPGHETQPQRSTLRQVLEKSSPPSVAYMYW